MKKQVSKSQILSYLKGFLPPKHRYEIEIVRGSVGAPEEIRIIKQGREEDVIDDLTLLVREVRRKERQKTRKTASSTPIAPEPNTQSSTITDTPTTQAPTINSAPEPQPYQHQWFASSGSQTVTVSRPDLSTLPKRSVPPAVLVELQNEPIPEYYDPEEEVDFSPEENLIRRRLYKVTTKFNVEWSTDDFGDLTCTLVNEDRAVNKLLARFEEWLQDNGIEMMPERILGTATDGAQKLGMPHTVRTFAVIMMALTPRDLGRMCDLVGEGEVKDVIVRFREENEDLIPMLIEND